MGAYGGPWATVPDAAPYVAVVSPNGGEALEAGSYHEIEWVAADDVAVTAVDIFYSNDGGSTYPYPIVADERNDGVHVWPAPDTLSDGYRVKVVVRDSGGNSAEDTSDGDFRVVARTGPRWVAETVDSDGWGLGVFTSVAFDANDNPAISYFDNGNFDLKFARWNGTTWDIETVDGAGEVGWYNSLAFDLEGNPAISYYDLTNSALKYAHLNGATWSIITVDSDSAGAGSSLAFDSQDNAAHYNSYR